MGAPVAIGAGLGLQALGGFLTSRSQNKAAGVANQRQNDILRQAAGMQVNGPSTVENSIQQYLASLPALNAGQGFNMGQDALMQMLRSGPQSQLAQSLNGMAATGNPFDPTQLLTSLNVADQRTINQNVAGLRASADGLGSRFGSAAANAEALMRTNAMQDINARNAQIAMGAHEAAQGRRLQADQGLLGLQQMLGGFAGQLQQGGLAQAGLQLQQQNFTAGLLQTLLQAEQARRGFNLQTLGLGSQMIEPYTASGTGGVFGNMGQLSMLLPFLMQMMSGTGGRAAGSSGTVPPTL